LGRGFALGAWRLVGGVCVVLRLGGTLAAHQAGQEEREERAAEWNEVVVVEGAARRAEAETGEEADAA
jgi:hypothetical protein